MFEVPEPPLTETSPPERPSPDFTAVNAPTDVELPEDSKTAPADPVAALADEIVTLPLASPAPEVNVTEPPEVGEEPAETSTLPPEATDSPT